ncbi:MAG: 13E12 repeat family protein, partial [Actinobacteria bacterium]|nr:13E12 repeat family protein [Actinomycetota bacterium]
MSSSTSAREWSSRAVPTALSPERLGALVELSCSRAEGMLFTATPAEELDGIGRWQRLKDLAFAGQMREVVAAYNRAGAQAREFAGDEVGLAIGATSTTGSNLVRQAVALAELPGLLEAVEDGLLTERHVLAVLRELDRVELTLEQRQAVVLVLLAGYRGQAPGELAQRVARLVVTVDRAAAEARDRTAAGARRVTFSRDVDGQALLVARGPAAQIAAIRAALDATLPEHAEQGDERSRDAREFDLFVDLLTGGVDAGSWHAEIVVPFSVAEGGDLELADIPGLGPVLPGTARDLL